MEYANKPIVAPDASFPRLLLLPKELRLEIYRCVFSIPKADLVDNSNAPVLIMSRNYDVGETSIVNNSPIKYVCNRDLSILQTCRQVREEAGRLFYHENLFALYLYMPDDAQLQSAMFQGPYKYVDLSRIRQCHISSAPNRWPRGLYDSKEESFLCIHFDQFAKALSRLPGHQMQYLLIECYHFEVAKEVGWRDGLFSLDYMIENLKMARGIKHVHIRTLNPELWPYLRDLERLMMSNEPSGSGLENMNRLALGEPAIPEGSFREAHEDTERASDEFFRRLGVSPLYQDTEFVRSLWT